jgi:hypothetical protein
VSRIDELVADLAPVTPPPPLGRAAGLWLLLSWVWVAALTLATGDLRPDAADQLTGAPRFLLECLFGLGVGVAAIVGAVRLGIPGAPVRRALVAAGGLAALWIGCLLVGLVDPALPASMAGKRPHCAIEAWLLALGPLALALLLLRRWVGLRPVLSGAIAGAAAGAIPALMMQLACMYGAEHALVMHLGPGLVPVALGALLGPRLLRRI